MLIMMKMQLERDQFCMLLSSCTCPISANIIVHCKRLQEYVKYVIKDEKILKPKQFCKNVIRILSAAFRI